MEKIDVAIIGAGIIGLNVAAEISKLTDSVFVLERHESFGQETSSRNSEVVHAGIYYPKDSLKAKTCIEGNSLIYQICSQNNIPHRITGKLIIALKDYEIACLEALLKNAKENGVKKIGLINKNKIKQMEPHIKAEAALYSETTGIVDTHSLMKYFCSRIKYNKANICYKTEVKKIIKTKNAYEIHALGPDREIFTFLSGIVINCGGLNSDTIAALAGIDIDKENYRLRYCKGQYFNISNKKSALINKLIYPVPKSKAAGLGIHLTKNLTGAIRLGPDDNYIPRENINYDVDENAKTAFYNCALKFLPFLTERDLTADISGIRPKLQGPGENFRDFIIKDEAGIGFPGFISLIGIESPGLTASASIAKLVSKIAKNYIF